MNAIDRAGYLAYARSSQFAGKLAAANLIISEWLSHCQIGYVAFSGGKDSTVLLDLVRRQRPETIALFCDDEWHLPETMTFLDIVPNLTRIASRVMHASWFISWEDGPVNLPAGVEWIEAKQGQGAPTWARENGMDGAAVGIRVDENNYRRIHVKAMGTCFYAKAKAVWQCYPLAHWTVREIWSYIVSRGLAYNAAYDRLGEIGVAPAAQRIGPLAQQRALPFAQLAILRTGWPRLFDQFAAKHPEAYSYV